MAIFFVSRATDETNETNGDRIYAHDAEVAAENFVEIIEMDDVNFPVGSGRESIEVVVRTEMNEVFRFVVSGEPKPFYRAKRL